MDLLRHLNFFVTIAEEQHFGRAAARLGMAQPPLSQGLQRLERGLGVTLLDRGPRGVRLTAAGHDLLPRARSLLEDGASLRRVALRHAEAGLRSRIGLVPELGPRAGARIAGAVTGLTGQDVELTSASSVRLVDAVTAGALDVAVVSHPALLEGLASGPVAALRTDVLLPRAHPAAQDGGPVALRSLRDLKVATPPRAHGPAAYDLLLDTLDGRGCPPRPAVAEDSVAALALVASGHAFAMVTDPDLGADEVARRSLAGEPLPARFRTVWREPGPAPPVLAAIEDAVAGRRQAEGSSHG